MVGRWARMPLADALNQGKRALVGPKDRAAIVFLQNVFIQDAFLNSHCQRFKIIQQVNDAVVLISGLIEKGEFTGRFMVFLDLSEAADASLKVLIATHTENKVGTLLSSCCGPCARNRKHRNNDGNQHHCVSEEGGANGIEDCLQHISPLAIGSPRTRLPAKWRVVVSKDSLDVVVTVVSHLRPPSRLASELCHTPT